MKKIKKIMMTGSTLISASLLGSVVSCSLFTSGSSSYLKSNLNFWNYEDYAIPSIKSDINKIYKYREFGDLPEFEIELRKGNVVGGIGSDYYNAMLAQKGLISKLDLSRVFPAIGTDRSLWSQKLQEIYSKTSWEILNFFPLKKIDSDGNPIKYNDENNDGNPDKDANDKLIKWDESKQNIKWVFSNDIDGDGNKDYLWEYMIPYFVQNKVVAINIGKALDQKLASKKIDKNTYDILKGKDQEAISNLFTSKTYSGIFSQLKSWGYESITINNYLRDNLIIGSESLSKTNPPTTTGIISSFDEARQQIDAFSQLIKNNFSQWQYKTDGAETLNSVVDKREGNGNPDSEVALMYNGDAFDANNGTDIGFENTIRIVVPENSSFLLDGVVMSSTIKNNVFEKDRYFTALREMIFSGYDTNESYQSYTGLWNRLYNNWNGVDGVGYTPTYKHVLEFADTSTKNDDPVGNYILMAVDKAYKRNGITNGNMAQPISESLLTKILFYYNNAIST